MQRLVGWLSRWPLKVLYGVSSYVIYPTMYYVLGYRKKVVAKNIANSFPEKTKEEQKEIVKAFYRSLADVIVEIIYGYKAHKTEMAQRVVFENVDELVRQAEAHGAVIIMLAHMGNWEWFADLYQHVEDKGVVQAVIYRSLKSEAMDVLMQDIRRQRGSILIEKNQTLRQMVRLRAEKKKVIYGFICDQKPRPQTTNCWTEFLHQETGFLDGSEVLAKKFDYPVFYAALSRTSRGHYKAVFELISDKPKQEEENAITLKFAALLEKNIKAEPELWLWTHNRWKWPRVDK